MINSWSPPPPVGVRFPSPPGPRPRRRPRLRCVHLTGRWRADRPAGRLGGRRHRLDRPPVLFM